ncbi:hypothetical protein QBC39DRAFT_353195 [Podospora conica]|nr:hypothetical protein QBC39DRAFT_353195 [Schizothecium conicum]
MSTVQRCVFFQHNPPVINIRPTANPSCDPDENRRVMTGKAIPPGSPEWPTAPLHQCIKSLSLSVVIAQVSTTSRACQSAGTLDSQILSRRHTSHHSDEADDLETLWRVLTQKEVYLEHTQPGVFASLVVTMATPKLAMASRGSNRSPVLVRVATAAVALPGPGTRRMPGCPTHHFPHNIGSRCMQGTSAIHMAPREVDKVLISNPAARIPK